MHVAGVVYIVPIEISRLPVALTVLMLAGCASVPPPTCDRACLLGTVDQYLAAVVAHDPARIDRSTGFHETQNAAAASPGTGIWSTARRLGNGVRYADPDSGEVGFFGVIDEEAGPALVGLGSRSADA